MIRLHLLGTLDVAVADGRDVRQLLTQPKRLALLAYLATRPAGEFVRRDTLLGVFWPDLDQAAARRSLRQALHKLRAHLGGDAFLARGDDEVALNPAAVRCDVAEFLGEIAERRFAEALEVYRGELLAGFFLSGGAVAFERWLEEQRAAFRDRALRAAMTLADEAERAGDAPGTAGWARRALALAPDDELVLRRAITLLDRAGDRAGTLRAYDTFARRLGRELGEAPSEETRRLIVGLKGAEDAAAAERPGMVTLGADPRPAPPSTSKPAASPRRVRWPAIAAGAVVMLAGVVAVLLLAARTPPVLAVGAVTAADSGVPAIAVRTLPGLLTTDLARVGGLTVVTHARLDEVAGRLAARHQPAGVTEAALAAGATELLEGVLYRLGADSLRLDLRRVDPRSGVLRGAVTLAGRDVFQLADSAAARFAGRIGRAAPTPGLAAVTSTSLVAHGLYDEGLRLYYRDGDDRAAGRFFQAALEQDSSFAMAAYYLGRSQQEFDPAASEASFERAVRLISHATEREALLIRVQWPAVRNDPAFIAVAESLGRRYPDEPEARYDEGLARAMTGDFPGAMAAFGAAVRLDSVSLVAGGVRCTACDAYQQLVFVEIAADSMGAALRDAAYWQRAAPGTPASWDAWAEALERNGRMGEAVEARGAAARLRGEGGLSLRWRAYYLLRAGDVAAADTLLAAAERAGTPEERSDALWWRTITLRYAGRPRAAAAEAGRYIAGLAHDSTGEQPGLPLGQALFEAGDLAGAARAFESAATAPAAYWRAHPYEASRHRAWALAHRATVAAAQGDLARLRVLAETIAVNARASALGRDRRLPAYVRGLLLERTGQLRLAADSFRAAVSSPTEGFSRVNLELARVLLSLGRPPDALYWIQAALRGGLEGGNYYVTRSELHEMAGRIFAALGQRDSARTHYAFVARAWINAEPAFQARRRAAEEYLAATRTR